MRILTLSSVFPNPAQPLYGLFVRERMLRVAEREEVRVVAPVPWSPLDGLARKVKPGYRPARPGSSEQNGLSVLHPGFLCLPGVAKAADGYLYYWSVRQAVSRIWREFKFDVIDAHFAYPDGVAAALLARDFGVPFTVTLRGTEVPYSQSAFRRPQMRRVLANAARVISVSRSLGDTAVELGCAEEKIRVIPNGVDVSRFQPEDRLDCRKRLGLPEGAPILLSVGALVPRKGFHRVIELLPKLRRDFHGLTFVIVGGASAEGDFSSELRSQVARLGLNDAVQLVGPQPPESLPAYYSAADVFVLATGNEGWANVFLESLACGTPVVTTDVGGNREVIAADELGSVVAFGDATALEQALRNALLRQWNRDVLVRYARRRGWDQVADEVLKVFRRVADERRKEGGPRSGARNGVPGGRKMVAGKRDESIEECG